MWYVYINVPKQFYFKLVFDTIAKINFHLLYRYLLVLFSNVDKSIQNFIK